jgi:hypothetical protein
LFSVVVALTLLLSGNGYSQSQIVCSLDLVKRESNFNLHSRNTSSGAYGLFQLMRIDKKLSMQQQVDRYDKYIKHRYENDACLALQHAKKFGWY